MKETQIEELQISEKFEYDVISLISRLRYVRVRMFFLNGGMNGDKIIEY